MKDLLTNDPTLLQLAQQIKSYSDTLVVETQESTLVALSSTPVALSEDKAARIIQNIWRKKKIKDAMLQDQFYAYRSMVALTDPQRQLSSLMFGHHVAEQLYNAKEKIDNPVLSNVEYYHRSSSLDNVVLNTLFKEFDLPHFDTEKYNYIPISLLNNNPIEDVTELFEHSIPDLKLIKKEPYSIAVLICPKSDDDATKKLKDKIRNMGLVASSWEIAENIKTSGVEIPDQAHTPITLDPNVPKTKEELLNSEIMAKLKQTIISGKKYPTALLAICIKKLLSDLPPNISHDAIQRIATILDYTNIFYRYNYARYALCVYAILHEISLALVENKNPEYLEQEYSKFKAESASTLAKVLSVDKEKLGKSTFIATASTSGASACSVAMRIASSMNMPDGANPKVKIFKPCYYELPNTFYLDSTDDAADADVLMLSAGPIVNPEGLTPGIDINLFVKHHVIDASRTKPVTLIVDATTALYKNLRLNEDVQELIATGQLSIIIHESHQKFGLIHTDQAQYGRVFGWCSNQHFTAETLKEFEKNSKEDFFSHSDIRIGSYVSTRCKETLEQIKAKHFANGSLLRKMLMGTSIISDHIEEHDDMQQNLDELYFLTNKETYPGAFASKMEYAAYGALEYRNSFGHYALTTADAAGLRRLSPDASDVIDNLAIASHMRLSEQFSYSPRKMLEMLFEPARTKEELSLDQQIALSGMLHSISSFLPIVPAHFDKVLLVDRTLTDADKKQIISSSKTPKDIIISKNKDVIYLGYHSHGSVFRQTAIKDPEILALINAGTITAPKNASLLKAYLQSLQKQYLPVEADFPIIYAAMSNALECCPSLNNRPFIVDINNWLDGIKSKIIEQYKPENPAVFIKNIREMYTNNYFDRYSTKYALLLLNTIDPSKISPQALQHVDFLKAIKKIYEGNQQILEGLKSSPEKYKLAKERSKIYVKACFNAAHDFYSIKKPEDSHRSHFMEAIKKAEDNYAQVLSVDRTTASLIARRVLQAVTNFIAALTFGAAHYINYKTTGNILFFSGTTSERKLKQLDRVIVEDTQSTPANSVAG